MGDSEAKKKWQRENTTGIGARLSNKTDDDILQFLESQKPKTTAAVIKEAIRAYMKQLGFLPVSAEEEAKPFWEE